MGKGFKIWFVFTGMLLLAAAGFATEIADIKFDQQGGYKFPQKMLLYNVQQKTGKKYNKQILNEDIKRLYRMGYFSDVVSETTKLPGDKVSILIKLSVKPRVKAIIFEGNQKFKTKELKNEIRLSPDVPLNDNSLRVSANRLRHFYKSKGYNDATITPILKPVGKGQVDVVFKIAEHLRLKVDNVKFVGDTVYSQWKLKNSIANRHSFLSRFIDVGLFNRDELGKDKARLRELYWDKGYLDFKVEKIEITQQKDDPEYVDITFKLFEGKPYKVGKITVSGNKIFSSKEIMGLSRLEPGKVFDYELSGETKKAITNMYESLGYADIAVRGDRMPNFKTHTVDVNYNIFEGRKYAVKDVIISGNKVTKDKVIRRELVIQPGDPLDKNRIKASRARLMGMGYFKKVDAVTINSDDIGKKNVQFDVDEKRFFNFKVGGGFSDTASLVGMAEISNNNFDLLDPGNWFSGGGQRFRIQAFVGIERNSLNVDFSEPWLFDIPLRLDMSGYLNEVEYDNWNEIRWGFKTSLSKKFFDDFTSATVGYKFERVKIDGVSDNSSAEMRREQGSEWVSQFSLLLNRDTRDSMLEPTEGYLLNLLGAVSPKILGSSNNFYRMEAKASYYLSFFEKAIICHVGGKIGVVTDFNRNNEAPLFERYFLGGGDTLRGFPYRSVAPTDNQEDPMGGQSMLLFTGEVSHPIWNFIRGAVFCDMGGVWKQSYSYGMSSMNIGVGYGLRIKVPYLNAPVKLDLAYPVLNNQDGLSSKLRFHFNMGFTW